MWLQSYPTVSLQENQRSDRWRTGSGDGRQVGIEQRRRVSPITNPAGTVPGSPSIQPLH
jgi:hypothetical protein